jgi:hypothetical protein
MTEISALKEIKCHKCQTVLEFLAGSKVLRHEECHKCGAAIHCCKMCKYYDPSAYNECRESVADRVVDKEKANYCDFFILVGNSQGQVPKDKLMDMANSIFKK